MAADPIKLIYLEEFLMNKGATQSASFDSVYHYECLIFRCASLICCSSS